MVMKGRVSGKVALVTGGALGIGRACAKRLAAEGAAVAVTDVLDAEGQANVNEICLTGGTAGYWHLDVSNEQEVQDVTRMVKTKFGPISVLVNNAAVSGVTKPTHEISAEEWEDLMNINVKGVFFCTKHVLPQMIDAGTGSVINLSSIYGIMGASDIPLYHASKGAVRSMSRADAMIYASKGIRVNSVQPGFIWTPFVQNYLKTHGNIEAGRKAFDALNPLGNVGEPDDIAYGVIYFASEESKFVTGTELIIDGGYSAR